MKLHLYKHNMKLHLYKHYNYEVTFMLVNTVVNTSCGWSELFHEGDKSHCGHVSLWPLFESKVVNNFWFHILVDPGS